MAQRRRLSEETIRVRIDLADNQLWTEGVRPIYNSSEDVADIQPDTEVNDEFHIISFEGTVARNLIKILDAIPSVTVLR